MSWSSGLQFRVIAGERERDRVIRLDGRELKLGRAQKGQRPGVGEVLFREPTVSRLHACLSWKERKGGFQLTHKSGTNPTLVNGKPVKKVMLAPGDRVQMGLLILEMEPSPAGRSTGSTSDGRGRPSMHEPILKALSKVEKETEEERRREKAEREQKKRQRELMATPDAPPRPTKESQPSRTSRLAEALNEAGFAPKPQPSQPAAQPKRNRGGSTFGWRPPEEREAESRPEPPAPKARPEVSYEDDTALQRRAEAEAVPSLPDAPRNQHEATYELVVISGPDRGKRFPLKDMVMVLGQRQGDADEREGQGVLLNDPSIPIEIAMFAWQGREGSYGLLASDSSREPLEVDRISEGARQRLRVDSANSILLKVADEIRVGNTTLRVQRIGEPLPPSLTRPEVPFGGEAIPTGGRPASGPQPLRRDPLGLGKSFEGRPPARPAAPGSFEAGPGPRYREPEPTSGGGIHREGGPPKPQEPRSYPPATQQPPSAPQEQQESGGVPLWAEATLVPGRRSDPSPPPPAPPPKTAGRGEAQDALDWGNRPPVDFLFEFVEGPSRGCQISISRGELGRGRQLFGGGPGPRTNELLMEEQGIPNTAFVITSEEGRFSLYNESKTGLLQVNRSPLKTGDRLVLMTGDTISLGSSVLRFLEREVVMALSQHGLYAESGVTSDQDRVFALNRQRMIIGRGKGCDVRLSDLEVSRVHLGLSYSEGRFSIQHRSETNPTFLNGLSLLPGTVRTLKVGDRVRLSSLTLLRFVDRREPVR